MIPDIILKELPPTVSEFAAIRQSAGWVNPEEAVLQRSMNSSLYWVTAYVNNTLIGTARIIGDGAMYFYIQDVIVHPNHRNQGLGFRMMQNINQYIAANCPVGSTIGLLAAEGKETFYEKFGFVARNGENYGLGMCKFI